MELESEKESRWGDAIDRVGLRRHEFGVPL